MLKTSLTANNSQIKRSICKEVGQMLRSARKARGLSIRDMAKITGITRGHISKVESGQVAPDYMHVLLFEAATGVPRLLESVVEVIRKKFQVEVLEDVKIGMKKMLEYMREEYEPVSQENITCL